MSEEKMREAFEGYLAKGGSEHFDIYANVETFAAGWNAALQEREVLADLKIPFRAKRVEVKFFDSEGLEILIGEGAGIEAPGYLSSPKKQESEAPCNTGWIHQCSEKQCFNHGKFKSVR